MQLKFNAFVKNKLTTWPFWFLVIILMISFQACEKEDPPENPFDNVSSTQDTVRFDLIDPEPNTIAGIFIDILHPTCGNVGCHDGTFEPDFRTLESSYNTMVYQIPIKNDGNYTYRVHPGDPNQSVLMSRLHGTISPPMPIQLEPDSDWALNREEYIENIRTWIAEGARDVMGNTPSDVVHPRTHLAGAFARQGGELLRRKNHHGPLIAVNDFEPVEFFLAFRNDAQSSDQLDHNRFRFSADFNGFEEVNGFDMELRHQAEWERGMYGEEIPYFHRIEIPYETLAADSSQQLFFRAYVKDIYNPITEIPTNEGVYAIKEYMSILLLD